MAEPWEEFAAAKTDSESGPRNDFGPWSEFSKPPQQPPIAPEQVQDATANAVTLAMGPGSLAHANAVRDSFNEDEPVIPPAPIPMVDVPKTFLGELGAGIKDYRVKETFEHLGNAAEIAYNTIREPLSPLIGPTEAQRIRESTQFGTDEHGDPVYEYKPLGDRPTKEQGLLTSFLPMKPLPPDPKDSKIEATLKSLVNIGEGIVGGLTSPGGIATMGTASALPGTTRAIGGAFAAEMGYHVPSQIKQGIEGKTFQERMEGWLGAITGTAFAALGARESIAGRPKAEDIIPYVREELAKIQEQFPGVPAKGEFRNIPSETLDGLHVARERLRDQFENQTPEVQAERQALLDSIDDQLLAADPQARMESQERVGELSQSKRQESAPVSEPSTGEPSTARSRLFEEAQRETAPPAEAAPDVVPEPTKMGPGAMGPAEAMEMKTKPTGTKNEVVAEERALRGEEEILKGEPVSNIQAISEAREVLKANPAKADEIVTELNNSTRDVRSISAADEAVLMAEKVNLTKQRIEQETIYGSGDATEAQRAVAKQNLDAIETKLNALDQATYASGQEWGRMGQLRQRLLRQDYSLESMERRARIQKGESLTPEERTKIKEQSSKIQELETKLSEIESKRAEAKANQAAEQAHADLLNKANTDRIAPRVLALAESIVSRLDKAADAARKRITERAGKLSAGVDPVVVYDVAVIGASKLARASLDFTKWSAEMTADLGEWVKPYLSDAWKETEKIWAQEEKRLGSDRSDVSKVRARKSDAANKSESVSSAISERAKSGDKPEELRSLVQNLALETVRAGEKTREGLIDKVHETLKQSYPEITRSQTRDLISGYGDFKALSKDAAKTTLRGLKGEMQQIGKIEDMQAKQAPKKTGVERRTPTDEERKLQREVNELKKKGGFEVVDKDKQLKTALDAVKTRLNNELRDLDTAIATKERITPKKNVIEYDAEAKALKERRDAKKAEYDELFPKEPLTDAQMIDRAGKALDRSISQLEGDLKSGKLYGEKNTRKLTSPEIDAKRARLEALRAQRDELRLQDTATLDARSLAAYKTRTANRIAEIQEKIANQDFAPKPPKKELKLDAEALDLKAEIETVKEKYNEDLFKHKLAKRSMGEKIIGGTMEAINTARAILTSFDFSAVLRQGGFTTLGNPVRAARALPDMFRSFVSEQAQKRVAAEIQSRPNADLYQKAKLFLSNSANSKMSKMEEAYMSRWAKKIPLVAGSERAYTTFLNKIRADTFDALVKSLGDKNGVTLDEAKAIANFVNVTTGRGGLGKAETAGNFLSTVFFSPRYVASRFQLMAGTPLYKGTARTRIAIAKEYAKYLTGIALIYAMGKMAGGTVEENPRSSDFGKLKFGNTRIDPMGGILQNTVLLTRLGTGEKKTLRGDIVPIRGDKIPYKGESAADIMFRFARSKFSPLIGSGFDLASGKNSVGQPVTPTDVAKNSVVPMSLKDIGDVMRDQGVPAGTIQTMLSIFGLGVQNYSTDGKR